MKTKNIAVSFQGEKGAFSEQAIYKFFDSPKEEIRAIPSSTLAEVLHFVEMGSSEFGIIPVENSIGGYVDRSYELIANSETRVIGEVYLQVRHNLLGIEDTSVDRIETVYSHPQALKQCRKFLEKLEVSTRATYDTAGSAKMISRRQRSTEAAIASELAANQYALEILKKDIHTSDRNNTRFLVVTSTDETRRKRDVQYKTTITFELGDQSGALYHCLAPFAERNINLTMIKSRPTESAKWEYHFDLDLEGHKNDNSVQESIQIINSFLPKPIRILGSYPMGVKV